MPPLILVSQATVTFLSPPNHGVTISKIPNSSSRTLVVVPSRYDLVSKRNAVGRMRLETNRNNKHPIKPVLACFRVARIQTMGLAEVNKMAPAIKTFHRTPRLLHHQLQIAYNNPTRATIMPIKIALIIPLHRITIHHQFPTKGSRTNRGMVDHRDNPPQKMSIPWIHLNGLRVYSKYLLSFSNILNL